MPSTGHGFVVTMKYAEIYVGKICFSVALFFFFFFFRGKLYGVLPPLCISGFWVEFLILFSVTFPQVALSICSHLLLKFLCWRVMYFAIPYPGHCKCLRRLWHLLELGC